MLNVGFQVALRNNTSVTNPVDNSWTLVGENPDPYAILALRAVNGHSQP